MPGELYVVATPIGNLEDISARAIATLKRCEIVYAEDTREAKKLMELCGIPHGEKRIHSYSSHNMKEATEQALLLLQEGKRVALISDRGTPAISDPGDRLVSLARREGVKVYPIPGPSSVTALLSVSGHWLREFAFLGFTDKLSGSDWEKYQRLSVPMVILEAPHRIRDTLRILSEKFPQARCVIGREMTKVHEEYLEFSLTNLNLDSFPERGEYTLLVIPVTSASMPSDLENEVALRLSSDRDWSKEIARRLGVSAKEAYNLLQEKKRPK